MGAQPKRRSGRTDPNDPRHEWARRMRLLLSPPEMLLANGDIDQEYFRPKQVASSSLDQSEAVSMCAPIPHAVAQDCRALAPAWP